MDEQVLEDFFLNKVNTKDFVSTLFKQRNDKDGNFIITRSHLLQLCDLTIEGKITIELLTSISHHLIFSDYFSWDVDSVDGEVVSQVIFEWGNLETNYEINDLNVRLWREYLQTGRYKLEHHNNWNSHIQRQQEICKKANSNWRPINPKHKIGVSDNLYGEPVHGLRHNPEKGTTGWYIWTGEFSNAEDFFKPMHAGHLLQRRSDLIKYLGLQPGFRFLIDGKGYEDIWEDKQLLDSN
jgi:hypothetical protein